MSRFNPNTNSGGQQIPDDLVKYLQRVRIGAMYAGTVTNDGGSAGNSSTTCTFTYTVKTLAGIVIAKLAAVEKGRLVNCTMNAGTLGVFYYDANKAVHLWDVNETATQTNCS